MVNLGFINGAGQSPDGTHRVFLAPNGSGAAPTLVASSAKRTTSVELRWDVPVGSEHTPEWGQRMAQSIVGLRWSHWWLDCLSVSKTLGDCVATSLNQWGLSFWPHYRHASNIYLNVAFGQREQVYQSVKVWEKTFDHVRFNRELDLDLLEKQKLEAAANGPSVSHRLFGFIPALAERFRR